MKAPKRIFKDRVYEQLARISKAVASPQRLELLDLLSQSPRTVENLAQEAHLTVANTSRHLQILRAAHLITAEKEGVFVRYRLTDDTVADFDPATGTGTGFKFREYTPSALVHSVQRALAMYQNPAVWRRIQAAGMSLDFSWDVSAREYVKVYRALLDA